MFELPQTKRIRRSELLDSRSSSPDPLATTHEHLSSIFNFEYEYTLQQASPSATPQTHNLTTPSSQHPTLTTGDTNAASSTTPEEEFLFPLFSATASSQPTQLITLRATPPPPFPTLTTVLQTRPDSYYFHTPFPIDPIIPVTGEQILSDSRPWVQGCLCWPGSTSSRKLTTITYTPASNKRNVKKYVKGIGKCKPGKKRRIMLRKERERKVEEVKKVEEQERRKREKRMVRNREKKMKKRKREKDRKMGRKEEEDGDTGKRSRTTLAKGATIT